jgi:hypothetical protein
LAFWNRWSKLDFKDDKKSDHKDEVREDRPSDTPRLPRHDAAVVGYAAAEGLLADHTTSSSDPPPGISTTQTHLTPIPPPIDIDVLQEWSPRAAEALQHPPQVDEEAAAALRQTRSFTNIPDRLHLEMKEMLRTHKADGTEIPVNVFTRKKKSKNELRVIVDARRTNTCTRPYVRIGPRTPTISSIAQFLLPRTTATTCDFRNYFYCIPLGVRLQRLFYIPSWNECVTRLPMGWKQAPDIAAAISEAVVHRTNTSSSTASSLVCIDNILTAADNDIDLNNEIIRLRQRIEKIRITLSQDFTTPSTTVKFFGVQWNLETKTRTLPNDQIDKTRKILINFAKSRGKQSLAVWRRVAGTAGWASAVAGQDPSRRLGLLTGLRVAQHHVEGVVPGKRARREVRRLAQRLLRPTPMDAPAELGYSTHITPSRLSIRRHWLWADAATPGAIAVIHFPPHPDPNYNHLVYWRRVEQGRSAISAELEAVLHAIRFARNNNINYPVIITDNRPVYFMVRSGLARNEQHHEYIKEIRNYDSDYHLLWIRSEEQVADIATRVRTHEEAVVSVRSAVSRLMATTPKPGPDAIGSRVRARRLRQQQQTTRRSGY